jgi:hypothetical protein
MIDVESGVVLFYGQGHSSDATADDPEGLARVIAHRILARFGSQTGLLGSGHIGVNWELQELGGARYYLVRELRGGLPADKAGLKVGDRVSPVTARLIQCIFGTGCETTLSGGGGTNPPAGCASSWTANRDISDCREATGTIGPVVPSVQRQAEGQEIVQYEKPLSSPPAPVVPLPQSARQLPPLQAPGR